MLKRLIISLGKGNDLISLNAPRISSVLYVNSSNNSSNRVLSARVALGNKEAYTLLLHDLGRFLLA